VLDQESIKWLKELRDAGLMARQVPGDIQRALISEGLVEQKLGGLAISAKGVQFLFKHK
jgi:hypothetical protein